jgi:CO/xanthine dehydrogenase Mo-binding subunit
MTRATGETPNAARRRFLADAGALVVSFTLVPPTAATAQEGMARGGAPAGEGTAAGAEPSLPGSLAEEPMLDAWLRIDAAGHVTVFTGKAELGQGIRTALVQLAAEELMVAPAGIELVTADTGRTPDEGYTAGSQSMQHSGTAIQNAAAQAREILIRLAAGRLGVARDGLRVDDGVVHAGDGRTLAYGELVRGDTLHVRAAARSRLVPATTRTLVGRSWPRLDIPAKVSGGAAYVQDLRLPGMLHGRVVRPPSYGARLLSVRDAEVHRLPGVVEVVRDGSFLAVVARHEYEAVVAMRALARAAAWEEHATLPQGDLQAWLVGQPAQLRLDHAGPAVTGGHRATYWRPFQMHASIGPSCAVARFGDGEMTVWTHSQGVYPLRAAIAEMLGMPKERVRCIHVEGSGCYGHNAADDAAADAALLARARPGVPMRVQWMREHEHAWEPYGSAMSVTLAAELDAAGNVAAWQHEVWSASHSARPGPAGSLAAARSLARPFTPATPRPIPLPAGGGDRNAVPGYDFPSARVMYHFVAAMPLRVSALRSLGAYANVFAVESFMVELAARARADAVDYRLRHLRDPRARAVVETCARRFGWASWQRAPDRGRGLAYARYKTLAAYCAVAMEVEVDRDSGEVRPTRVVAAIDSGDAVNPDGIRNQTEGGIVQSLSWSLLEAVAFDATRIESRDFASYPILRFTELPDSVEVEVVNRPGTPFLGTGEAAQGPTAGALANAIADATGTRMRDLPFTRSRVKAALRA